MKTFSGIPKTVEEAIEQVLSGWSKEEAQSFKDLPVNDLFNLRNTLGADIRNVFSLWFGNDELLQNCEKYLTSNKEFYDSIMWVKVEKEQGKKRAASFDFISDSEVDEEDETDESLESFKADSAVPINPFIASQVIIFAVWNYLQVHGPTL